jgi:AcrR family transcriptional regulator
MCIRLFNIRIPVYGYLSTGEVMRQEARAKREAEIHAAAARLVAERGYGATSMLTIAKAARASNETLYRWYGDKLGLFKSMVVANTGAAKGTLDEARLPKVARACGRPPNLEWRGIGQVTGE